MLLIVGSGLLAGCGGTRASSADAVRTPTEEPARAFASAVNLQSGDLPGWEVAVPERDGHFANARLAQCDGGVSVGRIALEARSTLLSLDRGNVMLRSRVTVWPSEALALANFAAFASERGVRCELAYGATSVSRVSLNLGGSVRAVGIRLEVPSESEPRTMRHHDIIGFVHGPAEVVLTAVDYGHPMSVPLERRLLALLYRRASAAQGA